MSLFTAPARSATGFRTGNQTASLSWFLRGCLALLGILVVVAPRESHAEEAPELRVIIENIDTGRYPYIGVCFRVLDTNITSEFRDPTDVDINFKIDEQAIAGPDLPILDKDELQGFKIEKTVRPLALYITSDSSKSMTLVLPKVGAAIDHYVDVMINGGSGQEGDSRDRVAVNIFAGFNGKASVLQEWFTANAQGLNDFTDANYSIYKDWPLDSPDADGDTYPDDLTQAQHDKLQTLNGTPFYQALYLGIEDTSSYEEPNRAILILSDGDQFPPLDHPDVEARRIAILNIEEFRNYPTPWAAADPIAGALTDLATALKIPVFTMGLGAVAINAEGVFTRTIVNDAVLSPLASRTSAAFFKPRSPIPLVPDVNLAFTGEAGRAAYAHSALYMAQDTARDQGIGQDNLPAALAALAAAMFDPDPRTYFDLMTKYPGPGVLPAFNAAELNALTDNSFISVHNALVALRGQAGGEISESELDAIYTGQVKNMLLKIRASLKNLYCVEFLLPESHWTTEAEDRELKLNISYLTDYKSQLVRLEGEGRTVYKTPDRADEDEPKSIEIPVDEQNPAITAMLAATNPRGGAWKSGQELKFSSRTSLWSQIFSERDRVYKSFKLAQYDDDGVAQILDITADPDPDLDNPLVDINDAEKAELGFLLAAAKINVIPDTDSTPPKITVDVRVKTPMTSSTWIPVPDGPPLANDDPQLDHRAMWFTIEGDITRDYSFDAQVPDGSGGLTTVPRTATIRYTIPPFKVSVSDITAPTLGVYLNSDILGSGGLEARESPIDAVLDDKAMAYTLNGAGWSLDPNAALASVDLTNPPDGGVFQTSGDPVKGFFVRQGERFGIRVIARDNYDRNVDHSYLSRQPIGQPSSNELSQDDAKTILAQNENPPYLPRGSFDELGEIKGTRRISGVSWRLLVNGVPQDELADTAVLRSANVRLENNDIIDDGDDVFLEVRAVDAGNNRTDIEVGGAKQPLRIPIKVLPVELDIQQLLQERRKAGE